MALFGALTVSDAKETDYLVHRALFALVIFIVVGTVGDALVDVVSFLAIVSTGLDFHDGLA